VASEIVKGALAMLLHISGAAGRERPVIVEETLKKRISNHEYRMTKEGILTILQKDRAQRFNPSKFVIRNSAVRFSKQIQLSKAKI